MSAATSTVARENRPAYLRLNAHSKGRNRTMSIPRSALAIAILAVASLACSEDGPTAIEIPLAEVEIITPCPTGQRATMRATGATAS